MIEPIPFMLTMPLSLLCHSINTNHGMWSLSPQYSATATLNILAHSILFLPEYIYNIDISICRHEVLHEEEVVVEEELEVEEEQEEEQEEVVVVDREEEEEQ